MAAIRTSCLLLSSVTVHSHKRDAARESQSAAQQELEESRETLAREWSFGRFVGRSPVVREL